MATFKACSSEIGLIQSGCVIWWHVLLNDRISVAVINVFSAYIPNCSILRSFLVKLGQTSAFTMIHVGILQILVSSLCLSVMSFVIKDLHNISSSNLLYHRAIIQIILCLLFSLIIRVNPIGEKNMFKLLHLRGIVGGIAVLLYFATLKEIPVSTATALFMTTPLYTIFLARMFLQDKITYSKSLAVFLVLLGTVLIAHPSSWTDKQSDLIGSIFAISEAMVAAIAVTIIKIIGNRAHYVQLVFYLSVYMLIMGLGLSIVEGFVPIFDVRVIIIGFLATAGQLLMNAGLQKVTAVVGMTVRCSEVLFAFIIGIFVGEDITNQSIYGSVLIILGSYLVGRKSKSDPEFTRVKSETNDEEAQVLKRKSFSSDDK
eukprot:NODE_104_length_19952_cov_0.449000.p2 type:complete len:372 gc:universal NODE_104_length_19952_cov_0.449000:4883-5998(+)